MSKKCTPLWREAHVEVKMYKAHHSRTTFGSWDVQKVHAVVARSTFRSENVQSTLFSDHFWKFRSRKSDAVVARSTFPSQNVQNTPAADHFWSFRCRKSARHCGAKHISKWKCTKHTILGPLLEVQMSKKCTPLWREAHFEVKMYKTHHSRTTFGSWDVQKVHAVVARSTFRSENVQNTPFPDHFWKFRSRKSDAVVARSTFPTTSKNKVKRCRPSKTMTLLKDTHWLLIYIYIYSQKRVTFPLSLIESANQSSKFWIKICGFHAQVFDWFSRVFHCLFTGFSRSFHALFTLWVWSGMCLKLESGIYLY